MSPFAFLGLRGDADERAIKRVYSQRLRETRPDTDPGGFQQLHAAYKAALEIARSANAQRAAAPVEEVVQVEPVIMLAESATAQASPPSPLQLHFEHAPPATPPTPRPRPAPAEVANAPAIVVQEPAFDFDAFFATMSSIAGTSNGVDLAQWLHAQPALWSFTRKAQTGHAVLAALERSRLPVSAECFDAILAFFDLDHVLAGLDAVAVQRLRRQLHLGWELQAQNFVHLAARMRKPPAVATGDGMLRSRLEEASKPFRWWRTLARGLQPYHASNMTNFLHRLSFGFIEELPERFDRQSAIYWRKAAFSRAVTLPRVLLGFSRIIAAILIVLAFGTFLDWSEHSQGHVSTVGFVAIVLSISAVWAVAITWQGLAQWQRAKILPSERGWRFWLRLAFVPGLACLAVAFNHLVSLPSAVAPALLATVFAVTRLQHRLGVNLRIGTIWTWLALAPIVAPALATVLSIEYANDVIAAFALNVWGVDLWKQRFDLSRR